ncbi:MAG: HDOD domain-containing protein [Thermodesulfobacteriota bacterium]
MTQTKGKDVDIEQQISFLKRIQFFHNFDDSELKQFLVVSRWLKVPKDTVIIRENTVERVFYILVRGTVSVCKGLEGSQESIELTSLSTGDCFGEMALVGETRRTAAVVATSDSYILRVEPDIISKSSVFLQLKFYKRFCEILVARLILANAQMVRQQTAPREVPHRRLPPEPEEEIAEPLATPPGEGTLAQIDTTATIPELPPKKEWSFRAGCRRRVQSNLALPINPVVADTLTPYLSGDADNTRRLAELFSLDPWIAARVLQLANSPFYRRSAHILSLPHAMITVGIKDISKVVLESIQSRPTRPAFGSSALADAFWQHSVVTARIAQILKDILRINLPEDVALAGILHDLGMLAVDALEPGLYPHLLAQPAGTTVDEMLHLERDYAGVDHETAGRWLGDCLGLPQAYVDVMTFHHRPDGLKDNVLLVALVHLGKAFAMARGMTVGSGLPRMPLVESPAWALLREEHRPFADVVADDFIQAVHEELSKMWPEITALVPM